MPPSLRATRSAALHVLFTNFPNEILYFDLFLVTSAVLTPCLLICGTCFLNLVPHDYCQSFNNGQSRKAQLTNICPARARISEHFTENNIFI